MSSSTLEIKPRTARELVIWTKGLFLSKFHEKSKLWPIMSSSIWFIPFENPPIRRLDMIFSSIPRRCVAHSFAIAEVNSFNGFVVLIVSFKDVFFEVVSSVILMSRCDLVEWFPTHLQSAFPKIFHSLKTKSMWRKNSP